MPPVDAPVSSSLVDVVRIAPNGLQGPCRPRNEALAMPGAPWVLLLDSDAEPYPDCVGRLLDAVRAHPDVSVVVPRVLLGDGRIHFDAGRGHFLGEMCLENRGRTFDDARKTSLRPDVATATALLIRRDHALRAGGFDERLVFFREDLEFCLRLRAMGYGILHAPDARVRHVRSAPRGPLHERRVFYQTRNRWWVLLKLLEARTLVLTLPLQVLYELPYALLALRQGKPSQHLAAFVDLARRLPVILRDRAAFQSRRVAPDRDHLGAPELAWREETNRLPGARPLKAILDLACRGWWRLVAS